MDSWYCILSQKTMTSGYEMHECGHHAPRGPRLLQGQVHPLRCYQDVNSELNNGTVPSGGHRREGGQTWKCLRTSSAFIGFVVISVLLSCGAMLFVVRYTDWVPSSSSSSARYSLQVTIMLFLLFFVLFCF